jgi:hypothetical protein
MKLRQQSKLPLAKGQVWNTGAAQIEIMALNNRFIHYKVTKRLGLKHVSSQISGIEAMEGYLKANRACLVQGPSEN